MKVLIASDLHLPFHSKPALKKFLRIVRKERPTHVLQIGDLLDQYVFSRYSRSASISLEDDLREGLKCAEKFWKEVRKAAPKAKCYQILGNHDVRMAKRISEKLPELSGLFDYKTLYQFTGVKLLDGDRDYLELGGVVYCHGWLSKSHDHAIYFNKPVVHGHRHRPEISYISPKLWSMDVGFMADRNSLPLSYTMSKFSKWTMACGIVDNGQPILIVLE